MKQLKIISAILLAAMLISPAVFAATSPSAGKVRFILGEVTLQKKAHGNWNPLRVSAKVLPADLIRTLIESEAGIALSDGSLITIEENSLIHLSEAIAQGGRTSIMIDSGKVFFTVQKQPPQKSIDFRTPTATAAIRGTSGFIAQTEDGIVVSLETGKMSVANETNDSIYVEAGETLVQQKKGGFRKFKTSNAGTKQLAAAMDLQTKENGSDYDKLAKAMQAQDSAAKPVIDSLRSKNPCEIKAIPNATKDTSVDIQGTCKETVSLTIDGAPVEFRKGGSFSQAFIWDAAAMGVKRFTLRCTENGMQYICGELHTNYIGTTDFAKIVLPQMRLQGICDPESLTVSGNYGTLDSAATVTLRFGALVSPNLAATPNVGTFSYTFPVADSAKSGKSLTVTADLKTAGKTFSDTAKYPLDPECTNIKLDFTSSDSLTCEAKYSVHGVKGTITVSEGIDGIPTESRSFTRNTDGAAFSLISGEHTYSLIASDGKGNTAQIAKVLRCKNPMPAPTPTNK